MAVEAVFSVILQKLTNLLSQESEVFDKVINEVERVRIELREMQSILTDAEHQRHHEGSDKAFSKWLVDFLLKVYRVEYVLETFSLGKTCLQRMGFINKYAFTITNEFKLCRGLPEEMDYTTNIHRLKYEINKIRMELVEWKSKKPDSVPVDLHEGSGFTSEVRLQLHTWSDSHTYYVPNREETIFKKDVKKLLNQLTNNNKPLQIISIFGEIGSGKTAHVKTIYNKTHIKDHFQCRASVLAPADCSVRYLLLAILRQVTSLKDAEKMENEILKGKLHESLKGKRYLIVINDIRNADIFEGLRDALPDMYNGSRMMFTTSDKDVALLADSWSRYDFKPLDTEDGWNLFLKKVPALEVSPFPDDAMHTLKDKIAEICKGIPLRIMMIAGLLSTKKVVYDEWWSVFEQQSRQLIITKSPSLDIFAFCYNDLPLHLKPCFLYLGLFQKGFEIPLRRLFRLWLAEGFVKQSRGMIPEDLVEGFLEELVNRNMVEISKRRSDGSPRKCRMLPVLHDIFLPKAVEIGLFHIHQNAGKRSQAAPPFGVRTVVEYADIKGYLSSEKYNPDIRSYISFNVVKKDMPAEEVGTFLHKIIGTRGFGLLRVLDLERVYKPRLPEDLGNLFHLRYLGLRWTFLDNLPSSVGNLPYLETLDIKHTYISTLPSGIWKMKHLCHLCLNETRLDVSVRRPNISSLTQLQTLWGLFVDKKNSRKIGFNRMINLRKLGLTSQSSSFEELRMWISTLASLQSLRLRSKDKMGRPSELIIMPLSSLENLTQLYLLGNLPHPPAWYQFPPGLKVLTLSISQLKDDPMQTLSQLPSLIVLRLLAASYIGEEMDCPENGFPTLRVLKLWKLEHLKKWTVQKGAMQNLKTLEIRCCNELKDLPENLLQLPGFENLILTNMPQSIVSDIRKKKRKHTKIVENNWDF